MFHPKHHRRVSNPLLSISRGALLLRSIAFTVLVLVSGGLVFLIPPPPTIAVIQAITEFVSYDVVVPDLAQLRLGGYALTYEAGADSLLLTKNVGSPTAKKPICLSGVLTPTTGARISYKRLGTGPVSVVVERTDDKPAAVFTLTSGEAPAALQKSSWIRREASTGDSDDNEKPKSAACNGTPSTRLPIYGPTQIGTPLRPQAAGEESSSGVMIEGTVDLFAKTIEIGRIREGANRIYPTAIAAMNLPPGSQISEFLEKGQPPAPWAGFVKLDTDQALDIRVTTPATHIQILRPGIGMQPKTLAAGLFAQLTHDPVVLSLQVLAVFVFSVLQAISSLLVAREARKIAEEKEPASPP
jgi:hypothetical protein